MFPAKSTSNALQYDHMPLLFQLHKHVPYRHAVKPMQRTSGLFKNVLHIHL
jgi:hypothetical protein